jgi:predicted flap endonuclease-1-like 5' DNA nuclease
VKNPPILVAVIGFFAALAGFGFLFFGLRVLGFDWFGALGDLPVFESVGLWGWLAVITGIVWLIAAIGFWGLQPWARVFAQIMAGFALLQAVIAFFQFPGTGIAFGMALMPVFILWYLSTSEVKEAFGVGVLPAPAPEPVPAAPLAAAAPMAAAAVVEPPPAPAPVAAAPVAAAAAAAAPAASSTAPHHRRIEEVEGIGSAETAKLAAIGITTTDQLLAAGAKPSDRDRIAQATGISHKLILEWVDIVDLMRVPGVGPQYSDLLEAAGVDSPAELAQRNPANLAITVQEVIAGRPGIVHRTPSDAEVAAWVDAARNLDKVVEH